MSEIAKKRYAEWVESLKRSDAQNRAVEAIGDAVMDYAEAIANAARGYGLPATVDDDEVSDCIVVEMNNWPERHERKWDQPDVILSERLSIFILQPNEWLDTNTSSKHGHHRCSGPSIVTVANDCNGTQVNEYYAHDPKVWDWLGGLIEAGFKAKHPTHPVT